MSHRQERERRRHAYFCAEFDRLRDKPEAFWDLLRRIADSPTRVWSVADTASVHRPLDEAERAMVQEAAAPQLVRMTPGTSRLSIIDKDKDRLLGLRPCRHRVAGTPSIKVARLASNT